MKVYEAEEFQHKLASFIHALEATPDFSRDSAVKRIVEILKGIHSKADLKQQERLINRISIDSVEKWETLYKIGTFLKEHS